MTIQECYEKIGGNYADVRKRLPTDKMIRKFLKMFLKDPSYAQLQKAIEEKDSQQAFMAAHTLKGVSQNLGLARLYEHASLLSDDFRHGWKEEGLEHFVQMRPDYENTVKAIQELGD